MENATMDPPGRLVVLTLLGRCKFGTLYIASRYVPSYTELERITGLSRSTLYVWMKALTDAGWLTRIAQGDDTKTGIEIAIGKGDAVRSAPKAGAKKTARKPSEPETVTDAAYRSTIRGQQDPQSGVSLSDTAQTGAEAAEAGGRIAERYEAVSLDDTGQLSLLIQDSPTESPTKTSSASSAKPRKRAAKKAAPPADDEPTVNQRINRLARIYTDVIKLSNFKAIQGVVRTAVNSGDYTDEQIEGGMASLAAKRDFVTNTTLRISIEGLPKRDEQPRQSGGLKRGDFQVRDTHGKAYKGLKRGATA